MHLRIRTPSSAHTLSSPCLVPDSSLAELQLEIEKLSSIKPAQQTLKVGFPPKIVRTGDGKESETKLGDIGVKDGEQVIVEMKQSSNSCSEFMNNSAATRSTTHSFTAPLYSAKEEIIPLSQGGYLIRREVPDDNSCLFNSIQFLLDRPATIADLRQTVASVILSDLVNYNDAILGRPVDEYVNWIMKSGSWGGAIELSIFSKVYDVEICSIDIQTGRIDRFGENCHKSRVLLLYSGIHYDPISRSTSSSPSSPREYDQTVFDVTGKEADEVLVKGRELGMVLKKKGKFTDLANFTLRCNICNIGIKGQVEATEHAKQTGHASFIEYS